MKKLLFLIVLSCMVFGLTAAAAAAAAETKVYLDVFGDGNFQYDLKSDANYYEDDVLVDNYSDNTEGDGDLSGYILGLETTFNKFKVGVEYGIGDSELYPELNGVRSTIKNTADLTFAEVKGGYQVIDQGKFKLDLIMAVLDINNEITTSYDTNKSIINYGGNMLGVDFNFKFSEKASLQGTLASSLLGATVGPYEEDPSITEYKLKFNYFVTDNWALALGYRMYQYSASSTVTEIYEGGGIIYKDIYKNEIEGSITGLTLGGVYKF